MAMLVEEADTRTEVIEALHRLAERRAIVGEMIRCASDKLAADYKHPLLPVLLHFVKAFDLPLGEVLPIRECLDGKCDAETEARVSAAIQRTRPRWSEAAARPTGANSSAG
jgi:hypothetical protein